MAQPFLAQHPDIWGCPAVLPLGPCVIICAAFLVVNDNDNLFGESVSSDSCAYIRFFSLDFSSANVDIFPYCNGVTRMDSGQRDLFLSIKNGYEFQ